MSDRARQIDLRALAAGAATVAIGVYAAVIVAYHFVPSLTGYQLLSMRWFWDISFYMQLVCYFFVGLFHVTNVGNAQRGKKLWAVWKMALALLFMSVPAVALSVAIANDWLSAPPPQNVILGFCIAIPAIWIVGDLLVPAFRVLLRKKKGEAWSGRRRSYWALSPLALLALIALIDLPRDGTLFLTALPALCYLQGSVGYFDRAFRPEQAPEEETGPATAQSASDFS